MTNAFNSLYEVDIAEGKPVHVKGDAARTYQNGNGYDAVVGPCCPHREGVRLMDKHSGFPVCT